MRIELITWRDASSEADGWKTSEELDDDNPIIQSVGWVVKETAANMTLAMDRADDDENHGRGRIPLGMVVKREELVPVNPCIEWSGALDDKGYGIVGTRTYGTRLAHRIIYMMARGLRLRPEEQLCHTCDNRKCINPNHLYVGNHADNAQDREERGVSTQAVATAAAAAKQLAKTQCVRGHEYTPENTRVYDGKRRCLTCGRENARKYAERKKLSLTKESDSV